MHEWDMVTIDPAFTLRIPADWGAEPDEDGGVNLVGAAGIGLLHLISFPRDLADVFDPGEELYIFLEDQGVELAEDEIEDIDLAGEAELALCEYSTEEEMEDGAEEEEGETYWIVAVAGAPGKLVFCNYSCPASEAETEREVVIEILRSLQLT